MSASPGIGPVDGADFDQWLPLWEQDCAPLGRHIETMPTADLMAQVCQQRLVGIGILSRDEMRLAGYSDDMNAIDVCAGFQE